MHSHVVLPDTFQSIPCDYLWSEACLDKEEVNFPGRKKLYEQV